MCLVAQKGRALPNGRATAPLDFVSELLRHHTSGPLKKAICTVSQLQNRKRSGVPKRAARLGWWMRPGRLGRP